MWICKLGTKRQSDMMLLCYCTGLQVEINTIHHFTNCGVLGMPAFFRHGFAGHSPMAMT